MALPSQTERQTEIGRSYVYGKRTGVTANPKKYLIGTAVVVLVAGSVWAIGTMINRRSAAALPDTKTSKSGTAAPLSTPTTTLAASPITNAPALTPPSSTPALSPTTISQGSTTRMTPAGGTGNTALRADPATTPSSSPTTPTSTPTSSPTSSPTTVPASNTASSPALTPGSTPSVDSSGRPGAVDVTRRDLTPNPAPTTQNTPGGSQPGAQPGNQPASSLVPTGSTSEVMQLIQSGEQRAAAGDLVQARVILSKALRNPNAVREDQERIRQRLAAINADLLFSPKIVAGDPLTEEYVVKSGDNLIKITRNRELAVDWRLIERVNNIKGNSLRVGQKLKLVRGPFHAIVHKGDYRLDLFQGSPDDPDSWTFIRSFKVGLGTGNSTPLGSFVVRPRSKLVNPHWVNPQTGQKFSADDPKNPIGEYWMGIEGVGDSKTITGYGLHGTIEPDSIGQQKSMGCVRLGDEDIKLLYEMLVEQFSVVKVVP